ncbi:uncharacterized protein [Solanum lycopersicum]|uniref:uncharacterized protein n=1 Tax=Solanum lycopersicum TaxID=4081 RepID=UPI003747851B
MSALQEQEQRRTMRWEKFIEGAFSVQKQKGKQQFHQKNKGGLDGGNNSGDVKQKFPPCKHCKRNTHMEKYCWWRIDAICGNCKKTGHVSKVCKSRAKASVALQAQVAEADNAHEEQLFAVSYFSISKSFDSLLLDSGCPHHLFNNVELFKFLDDTHKSKVKVGNDEAVEVKGRGTMSISIISCIKTISDVLYTPNMSQNLLMVGQMVENNYSLHFKNIECVVFDPYGVELFYVKTSNKMFSVYWEKITEEAYTITSPTCTNLWHKRFGHFNLRSIAEIKKELVENMPEFLSNAQSSRKQETTTQSTAEVEYITFASAVNQVIWLRKMIKDLGHEQAEATKIMFDNKSAVSISKNPVFHSRTKHVKIKFHFIREPASRHFHQVIAKGKV